MTTYVLVHGMWHGGWCWKKVTPLLGAAGHEVYVITLTGLGERTHLRYSDIDMTTHIQDVINVLEYEDLYGVMLVGHSLGGIMAPAVADRIPKRLAHIINLDGELPVDGMSIKEILPDLWSDFQHSAQASGDELWSSPPGWTFGVTGSDLEWMKSKLTAHPLKTWETPFSFTIYRLSRAPERRIFYVDVGNMPTIKAEQYLRDIMVKYRNKLVYDRTGEIKDDRKHLSMLEDFWLPRREGSKGTEITTLPGGQNLGQMDDVKYFEEKLYKALGIPISRLQQQQGFSLGRTTEITRDELKFTKFIQRLRSKFSTLFDDLLRVQLVLKNIATAEEWLELKEDIWYDFKKDNNFNELKEAELNRSRFELLQVVDPYVGRYVSIEYARKNILHLTEEEIEEIDGQMADEQKAQQSMMQDLGPNGQPLPTDQNGMPIQPGQPPALPGQQPQQQASIASTSTATSI